MQIGHQLQFLCISCEQPIFFSVLDADSCDKPIICTHCQQRYAFDNGTLLRQLKQFEALCRQIHASEEILGNSSVAVDIGPHHVKIPFRLLLTRLSSIMDLQIGDRKVSIAFRLEPSRDVPASEAKI